MKALRRIESGGYRVTEVPVADLDDDLKTWLLEQAQARGLQNLLAHADDGVIWGRVTAEEMTTSHDVFGEPPSPPLRAETLLEVRLFGVEAELRLWRTVAGWRAQLVEDTPDAGEHFDQPQLLWGDRRVTGREGFILVEEGQQGLRHAPPLEAPKSAFGDDRHPLYLHVRHYVETDSETGIVDVALSRLVAVGYEPTVQEVT